jgi:hypothetical protein
MPKITPSTSHYNLSFPGGGGRHLISFIHTQLKFVFRNVYLCSNASVLRKYICMLLAEFWLLIDRLSVLFLVNANFILEVKICVLYKFRDEYYLVRFS